jgi:membrane-bound lytic murein transglycosylase A
MTLDALKVWLAADPVRGRQVMQENRSFIFFRELAREEEGPLGAREIPLSEGRSLAVDTGFHALGTPIYVHAPTLRPWGDGQGFARLMIAQDVGSAIRGPERGDIYFGSGAEAGRHAGATKHPGAFFVLLPRRADADQAGVS